MAHHCNTRITKARATRRPNADENGRKISSSIRIQRASEHSLLVRVNNKYSHDKYKRRAISDFLIARFI